MFLGSVQDPLSGAHGWWLLAVELLGGRGSCRAALVSPARQEPRPPDPTRPLRPTSRITPRGTAGSPPRRSRRAPRGAPRRRGLPGGRTVSTTAWRPAG